MKYIKKLSVVCLKLLHDNMMTYLNNKKTIQLMDKEIFSRFFHDTKLMYFYFLTNGNKPKTLVKI